jgi:hypothetical protein
MDKSKPLEELHDERLALVNQLVEALAQERGHDLATGIPAALRLDLMQEVDEIYDRLVEHIAGGLDFVPSTLFETLLARLYDLDGMISERIEGGHPPSDRPR